ncbi:MAG: hypothetical protein LJF30_24220 [Acidobacteria bacterium]|jgi:hypothetical protein|nr:hypothetical protein [Acidobacteriota bacterium]
MTLKKRSRAMVVLAAAAALAAVGATAAPSARPTAAEEDAPFCCVANPRFAGICKVTLAEDETCADVLAYLNNAASVGKTYCGTTPIRGGWTKVECQVEEE